jgi:predicted small lipoprotein YifL
MQMVTAVKTPLIPTQILMKNQKLMIKKCLLLILLAASFGSFAGCQSKGPMEKTGEKVDEAVQDTKRAVQDAAD